MGFPYTDEIPDIEDLNTDVLPSQDCYKIDIDDCQSQDHHAANPIITSDFETTIYQDEPGASRVWHRHMPEKFQAIWGLEGEIKWTYHVGDGTVRETSVRPGEILYIPGGFHHKTEVVGDVPNRHIIFSTVGHVGRLNDLFGDHIDTHLYGGKRDRVALHHDNINDELIRMDESAVVRNPDDY